MQEFTFILRNEKAGTYRLISWILIIIQTILFLFLSISAVDPYMKWVGMVTFVLALLGLSTFFFMKKYRAADLLHPLFIICIISWTMLGFYWISIVVLVFYLLMIISTRKLRVIVSTNNIHYPSFPARTIEWTQLNNLILKDGLLSIDFRNNKLVQQMVEKQTSIVNEKEFNEFCLFQLRK